MAATPPASSWNLVCRRFSLGSMGTAGGVRWESL